jgi:hypothetical protein
VTNTHTVLVVAHTSHLTALMTFTMRSSSAMRENLHDGRNRLRRGKIRSAAVFTVRTPLDRGVIKEACMGR